MSAYAEEKLGLAAEELRGNPDPKKLQHVLSRTLVAVTANDFPEKVRPRYEAIRSVLLRQGKLSDETVSGLSGEEVRQVWYGLREICREILGR